MRSAKTGRLILAILLLTLFSVLCTDWLRQSGTYYAYQKKTIEDQEYRENFYSEELKEKEDILSEECRG